VFAMAVLLSIGATRPAGGKARGRGVKKSAERELLDAYSQVFDRANPCHDRHVSLLY